MSTNHTMLIIGGGLAGATAAATLRAEGHDGPIILAAEEDRVPYQRPPLSKGFLAGKEDESALLPQPESWYSEHNVELLRNDAVASLDPDASTAVLTGGRIIRYGTLLLATGASPRVARIPGNDLQGVHYLRTWSDSERLREQLSDGGRRVVLLGSGWIGMEVAATARELGNAVTVVGRSAVPLSGVLGEQLGRFFADRHREAGVDVRGQRAVTELQGQGGRLTGVVLDHGGTVPADVAVIALGVTPNTALAKAAGLEIGNGIVTDAALRTSAEHIYAAGDVAHALHPVLGQHLRSEHWANAIAGGETAARSMLGQEVRHDSIPYFYTDQFDLGMEYSGYAPAAKDASVVIRGSMEQAEFIAFWIREGAVVAGMNVNVWDVQEQIKDLISSGRTVNQKALADPAVDLGTV